MELMLVLLEFARANNESETKSKRVKSVIQSKIERVKKGEKVWFGVQKPSWIVGMKDGKFILDDDRVKLVKNIFASYLAGDSSSKIADTLNRSKIQTLRKLKNGIWTNVTVAEVLRNKNVIGWFGINGNEFDNYFPPIISAKDFQATQSKLAFNVRNRGGSKYGLVRNLFKGLLFCAECGQPMETKIGTYMSVKGKVNHYTDYICRGVKQKTGCNNAGRISVNLVELAIFENVLFKHPLNLLEKPKPGNSQLVELENQLAKTQIVINRLTDMTTDVVLQDETGLKDKLKQAVSDKEVLLAQLKLEKAKTAKFEELPTVVNTLNSLLTFDDRYAKEAAEWIKAYVDFNNDKEKRRMLKNLMADIFERITLRHTIMDNGTKTDIVCLLVTGEEIKTKAIKNRRGIILAINSPETKKEVHFKLLQDGTRIIQSVE